MVKVITFQEALISSEECAKRHLLLGNGFSIGCRSDIFHYASLYSEADFSRIPEAQKVFEVLETQDFELAINRTGAGSNKRAYLCEITYGRDLSPLIKRISAWSQQWELVSRALERDAGVPRDWIVRPWIFMPQDRIELFLAKFVKIEAPFNLLITPLEMTVPWCYNSWDRRGESEKPAFIRLHMRT